MSNSASNFAMKFAHLFPGSDGRALFFFELIHSFHMAIKSKIQFSLYFTLIRAMFQNTITLSITVYAISSFFTIALSGSWRRYSTYFITCLQSGNLAPVRLAEG